MLEQSENASPDLQRGRELYAERAWRGAYAALTRADGAAQLGREDLWRLVWSSALCGENAASFLALERIYQQELDREPEAAARAAFWLGFRYFHQGEASKASGWLLRSERALEKLGADSVVSGYLELPKIRRNFLSGQYQASLEGATRALEIAERFADPDLASFARNLQGRVLICLGQVELGLALHDEAMLAATSGELSPTIAGLVYCAAIASCQTVYEVGRVREWTASLHGWCQSQPELATFTGECLLSRAEVMGLAGEWAAALEEARRGSQQLRELFGAPAAGAGLYLQGEIHRLRGELELAEARYKDASQAGRDPQPGLSLLWLAQGRAEAAAAALRRAATQAPEGLMRAKLLPALVAALVATGGIDEAHAAAEELAGVAARFGSEVLVGHATRARGAVELLRGDAAAALGSLRQAFDVWQKVAAPYLAAETRVQLACAYQAMGDEAGAALEIESARSTFERLGAALDVSLIDSLEARAARPPHASGLSARELEVLRLVAAGKTNKLIATELCLSEKTVDRHVSNILAKLNVHSRAAATAFAYENKLL